MKKVKWGVLSTAKIANNHVIPGIKKSKNSILYAIASRYKSKAFEFKRKHRFEKSFLNYENMYKDNDVEAIYNPLPNHMHLKSTLEACKNKKHVLLEKPITLKSKEVDLIIKAATKNNVIVKEAFMIRHHPQWKWVKKTIKEGKLGKINSISIFFNYYNIDSKNIRNISKYGGGAIYDIGCYPILVSRYLLDKEPKRVIASSVYDKKFKIDILSSAILDFGDVHSIFTCSTQTSLSQQVVILGSKSSLIIENPFNAKLNKQSTIVQYNGSSIYRNVNKIKTFSPADQFCNQITNFSNNILKKNKIDYGLEDAKKNMKVIDAIFISIKKNKWIKISNK